ncbi:MAG: lipoyl(octanoyl) transferase LipB [Methylococcales bacterium]|nr:lipoyl(octanoyl) transferase LipB [Methylococcales bacterium]MCK5925496.1 lipoyl(octanoyl) transferase LipB [Methylococcales bacterium]
MIPPIIYHQGLQDYRTTWQAMLALTKSRTMESQDELWIVEHPPVYTFGLNVKPEHLLKETDIEIVKSDRGGQITYHAPGQLIIYTLLDLKRLKLDIRKLVTLLEQAMIDALGEYGLKAFAKKEAPGVYIDEKKIGSIGLRVKNNRCYHGLSLNNSIDLTPFNHINPCGYQDLKMTKLEDFNIHIHNHELAIPLLHSLLSAIKS